MLEVLGNDYKRLEYLKQVNDNIREEDLDDTLGAARLRLDSIRIISAS